MVFIVSCQFSFYSRPIATRMMKWLTLYTRLIKIGLRREWFAVASWHRGTFYGAPCMEDNARVPRRLSAVVVLSTYLSYMVLSTLRVRERWLTIDRWKCLGSASQRPAAVMLISILERRGQYHPAPNASRWLYASRPVEREDRLF